MVVKLVAGESLVVQMLGSSESDMVWFVARTEGTGSLRRRTVVRRLRIGDRWFTRKCHDD